MVIADMAGQNKIARKVNIGTAAAAGLVLVGDRALVGEAAAAVAVAVVVEEEEEGTWVPVDTKDKMDIRGLL
jgi:hypothetical protein